MYECLIYCKEFGRRVVNDGLSSLPDQLFPFLMEFLEYDDSIRLIECNCYLYQTWIRKIREIKLCGKSVIHYFSNNLFRGEVHARLEDSMKQLSIFANNTSLSSFDLTTTTLINQQKPSEMHKEPPGRLKLLSIYLPLFQLLLEHFPDLINEVHTLHLHNEFYEYSFDERQNEFNTFLGEIIFSHYLQYSIKSCLILEDFILPFDEEYMYSVLNCSNNNNIINLQLIHCSSGSILLSSNLKSLTLTDCEIFNLNDFLHQLDEVHIARSVRIDDVSLFQNKRSLYLTNCCEQRGTSYECLQDNEEIILGFDDASDIDFRRCFKNSKKIELECSEGMISVDLSYYEKVRSFCISKEVLESESSDALILQEGLLYSSHFPTTLRELVLMHIGNLKSLDHYGSLSHNLYKVEICACDSFESCEGLWNVPIVKLRSLKKLQSLKGLGGKTREVLLENLSKIETITELNQVSNIIISYCEKLQRIDRFTENLSLTVTRCPSLTHISLGSKVLNVAVYSCPQMTCIEGSERVPYVQIEGCGFIDSSRIRNTQK